MSQRAAISDAIRQELIRCKQDPVYFMKKYYTIQHPTKGRMTFNLYPFQEKVLKLLQRHDYSIINKSRQLGISTLTSAFALWMMLFEQDKNVLVLATTQATAKNMVTKVRFAYDNLPQWMQMPVLEHNRLSLRLKNGSQIKAVSAATDSARSEAVSLLVIDEAAFIDRIEDIFTAAQQTLATGGRCIALSTPNGLNLFYKMWKDATEKRSLYKPVEVHWSMVPGRDQKWKEETIRNTSEEQFRQEFETEFIGSTATLISATKLKALSYETPIESSDGFDVYEYPQKGHMYVITVDSSEGVGLDYSAFSVIDVTSIPYRQVAKYRNNKIPTLIYPTLIYSAGMKYNIPITSKLINP